MKTCFAKICILFALAGYAYCAQVPSFKKQSIEVPVEAAGWIWPYFKDIDDDGLPELLVLSHMAQRLFVYDGNERGFASIANQVIELPEGTAWFAVRDVSKSPGLELLISMADGLAYYYRKNGIFVEQPQVLLEAEQVFTAETRPNILDYKKYAETLGNAVPVIFGDRCVLYERDDDFQFEPAETISLRLARSIDRYVPNSWSLGSSESATIRITTKAGCKSKDAEEQARPAENEYIEGKLEEWSQDGHWFGHGTERKDINGDGSDDVVLWHIVGELNPRTTILVFIANKGRLPDKPAQILRCRGFPVEADYQGGRLSLLKDIDNDGMLDIVLAEPKIKSFSAGTLIETVISHGVDFTVALRLHRGSAGYSNKPDFRLDVTTMIPLFRWAPDLIDFPADFNADGRPDITVRRRPSEIDVYLSSAGSDLYQTEPQLTLEAPPDWDDMQAKDLNGDGISDIYLIEYEKCRLTLLLSMPPNGTGAAK